MQARDYELFKLAPPEGMITLLSACAHGAINRIVATNTQALTIWLAMNTLRPSKHVVGAITERLPGVHAFISGSSNPALLDSVALAAPQLTGSRKLDGAHRLGLI